MQAPVKEYAQKIIKQLKDDGNEIQIITARSKPRFEDPYKTTKEFLDNNNIVYASYFDASDDVYVAIEGMDGVGKTTVARKIERDLKLIIVFTFCFFSRFDYFVYFKNFFKSIHCFF